MSDPQDKAMAKKNLRTALVLGALAAGFFVAFFIAQSLRST
jgi:hypothetical protein